MGFIVNERENIRRGIRTCPGNYNGHDGRFYLKGKTQNILPERHGLSKGKLKLAVSSYVLKVRGANYITLRLRMFLMAQPITVTVPNGGRKSWMGMPVSGRAIGWAIKTNRTKTGRKKASASPMKSSFTGSGKMMKTWKAAPPAELTNIQKLYERYIPDRLNDNNTVFYHRGYITGIGTGK
ncbi:hypothetical protein P4S72_01240 [Vibrio sp. PP-XX7]